MGGCTFGVHGKQCYCIPWPYETLGSGGRGWPAARQCAGRWHGGRLAREKHIKSARARYATKVAAGEAEARPFKKRRSRAPAVRMTLFEKLRARVVIDIGLVIALDAEFNKMRSGASSLFNLKRTCMFKPEHGARAADKWLAAKKAARASNGAGVSVPDQYLLLPGRWPACVRGLVKRMITGHALDYAVQHTLKPAACRALLKQSTKSLEDDVANYGPFVRFRRKDCKAQEFPEMYRLEKCSVFDFAWKAKTYGPCVALAQAEGTTAQTIRDRYLIDNPDDSRLYNRVWKDCVDK